MSHFALEMWSNPFLHDLSTISTYAHVKQRLSISFRLFLFQSIFYLIFTPTDVVLTISSTVQHNSNPSEHLIFEKLFHFYICHFSVPAIVEQTIYNILTTVNMAHHFLSIFLEIGHQQISNTPFSRLFQHHFDMVTSKCQRHLSFLLRLTFMQSDFKI